MTEDLSELTLASPAKINVFLEVLGKRDDGFHELETVMLRTSLTDQMHFRRTHQADIQLTLAPGSDDRATRGFPLDDANLIIQAAHLLQRSTGCSLGAAIAIRKRIPAEAGLAGGSSNAATTLLALNQLWQLKLSRSDLHALAAELGSDLNFFVEDCRAAVCRGRGEQVQPIPMGPALHVVAARPLDGNATPEIFRHTTLPAVAAQKSVGAMLTALEDSEYEHVQAQTFNRLTAAAIRVNPSMRELMRLMENQFRRPVFMSGSGSTCFCYAGHGDAAKLFVEQMHALGVPFAAAMHC
ncbi:MAG: 4-(cytidine 5'-diphospho)-2-C-methyl-D-erythritol kinase [Planctomycetaceae bacterium]|nr:4-(cytidine 5'-diphospho)-2-C-methyl-D-erythritol kinase [Planctomycetaceae bacterium]